MKTFKLEIKGGNEAFADCPLIEVARILRELADVIQGESVRDVDGYRFRDFNGNTVGKVTVK